jgi:hypothetical protein
MEHNMRTQLAIELPLNQSCLPTDAPSANLPLAELLPRQDQNPPSIVTRNALDVADKVTGELNARSKGKILC